MHRQTRLALAVCLFGVPTSGSLAGIGGVSFAPAGADVAPRYFHAASMLPNGVGMVSGGLGLQIFPPSLFSRNSISFYDSESGTFAGAFVPIEGGAAVTPALSTPRSSHTQTTLLDGRVLIAGGHTGASGTSPGVAIDSVELFDPYTGMLAAVASMATPRAMHTATLLRSGRVVVAGASSWQVFDPTGEQWSANAALVHSRTAHAAVLLPNFAGTPHDDRVLLIGGAGSGPATCELLNPETLTSVPLSATLAVGVDDLAATRLPGGVVFVVGGQNVATGDTVATTYLLDPAADTIVAGPDVPHRSGGIADHQLVRFGAYVLVLGGEQQSAGVDTILDYAAVFDGTAHAWLDDGAMLNPHDDFAVLPLGDCSTLIIDGGVPLLGQEAPSSNCETLTVVLAGAYRAGDLDNDTDTDADDLFSFAGCMTGPDTGPAPFRCRPADLDGDGDIDAADLAALQRLTDNAAP